MLLLIFIINQINSLSPKSSLQKNTVGSTKVFLDPSRTSFANKPPLPQTPYSHLEIFEKIGEGKQGVVFRCQVKHLPGTFALKRENIMSPFSFSEKKCPILNAINFIPHTVKIITYSYSQCHHYTLMEYVKMNKTLADIFKKSQPIYVKDLLTLFIQYTEFLEGCLKQNITPLDSSAYQNIGIIQKDEYQFCFFDYGFYKFEINLSSILSDLKEILKIIKYSNNIFKDEEEKKRVYQEVFSIIQHIDDFDWQLSKDKKSTQTNKTNQTIRQLKNYTDRLKKLKASLSPRLVQHSFLYPIQSFNIEKQYKLSSFA